MADMPNLKLREDNIVDSDIIQSSAEDIVTEKEDFKKSSILTSSVERKKKYKDKQEENQCEQSDRKIVKFDSKQIETPESESRKVSDSLPIMAEFSIIIKKKDINSDGDSIILNSDSIYDSSPRAVKQKDKKKKVKKAKSSQKRSPKKKEVDLPICPVCHESLDERVKRVYSRPISTGVYFPFLDQEDFDQTTGRMPKVKICYPCYENLMVQWKEYNKIGLPHRKRKYRDLNGKRIKSEREILHEEMRKKEIEEINSRVEEEDEEEKKYDEKGANFQDGEKNETSQPENMDDFLAQIYSHIELVEIKSNANLEKTKTEIEHSIRKHSNRLKDDIQGLKVENEVVRKQVVRMRRELAEMRLEVLNDVRVVKKEVLKQGKRQQKEKDSDSESNKQDKRHQKDNDTDNESNIKKASKDSSPRPAFNRFT